MEGEERLKERRVTFHTRSRIRRIKTHAPLSLSPPFIKRHRETDTHTHKHTLTRTERRASCDIERERERERERKKEKEVRLLLFFPGRSLHFQVCFCAEMTKFQTAILSFKNIKTRVVFVFCLPERARVFPSFSIRFASFGV